MLTADSELSPNLGDGRGSGGGLRLRPNGFDAVGEFYPVDQFRQLVVAVQATPALLRYLGELEDHGQRRLVGGAALRSYGSMAHGGDGALDGIAGSQVLPMLGREVVEREERLAVLGQAGGRLIVLDGVALDESVERGLGVGPGVGHPDVLQGPLPSRLLAPGQFVEHVRGLVHPAALAARLGPDLLDGLPEAERAIRDRELRPDREPLPLRVTLHAVTNFRA